jgi:hypothetical protein
MAVISVTGDSDISHAKHKRIGKILGTGASAPSVRQKNDNFNQHAP